MFRLASHYGSNAMARQRKGGGRTTKLRRLEKLLPLECKQGRLLTLRGKKGKERKGGIGKKD